jgi:hypothetical protein
MAGIIAHYASLFSRGYVRVDKERVEVNPRSLIRENGRTSGTCHETMLGAPQTGNFRQENLTKLKGLPIHGAEEL